MYNMLSSKSIGILRGLKIDGEAYDVCTMFWIKKLSLTDAAIGPKIQAVIPFCLLGIFERRVIDAVL